MARNIALFKISCVNSWKTIRNCCRHESPGAAAPADNPQRRFCRIDAIDIDKIKPGMSKDELERVRQEVARLATQALRGM